MIIRDTIRSTNQFLRNTNAIRRIGIHNTGVDRSSIDCRVSLERHRAHWRSLGWTNDGYNEIIARDGRVFILLEANHVANGVGGHNDDTYQIAVEGLGNRLTVIQRTRLLERIRHNQRQFSVSNANVLGHREFSGHATNSCPNMDMPALRRDITQTTAAPAPSAPVASSRNMHRVTARTGGFANAADAQANRNRRTWVEPGEYHVFNRSSGMINVTRSAGVPGSWINPTGVSQPQPAQPTTPPPICIGSRVRVNQNANTWATGQAIPAWVRGQTYTVQQLRNNNRELLLAGVLSWIRTSDVTVL